LEVKGAAATLVTLVLAALALAAGVPTAGATDGCSSTTTQPFLPWLDVASYTLAPNGGFEHGGTSWRLRNGAATVPGNEPFHVTAADDETSLALPPGASATSAEVCVRLLDPTLRLFASNTGSSDSTLKVEVLYTNLLGQSTQSTVATLAGASEWRPTLPLPFVANLGALPLLTDGTVSVAFRFTAEGDGGAWRIDDVYVDPFKGV
jgi:hypothetical protein